MVEGVYGADGLAGGETEENDENGYDQYPAAYGGGANEPTADSAYDSGKGAAQAGLGMQVVSDPGSVSGASLLRNHIPDHERYAEKDDADDEDF